MYTYIFLYMYLCVCILHYVYRECVIELNSYSKMKDNFLFSLHISHWQKILALFLFSVRVIPLFRSIPTSRLLFFVPSTRTFHRLPLLVSWNCRHSIPSVRFSSVSFLMQSVSLVFVFALPVDAQLIVLHIFKTQKLNPCVSILFRN